MGYKKGVTWDDRENRYSGFPENDDIYLHINKIDELKSEIKKHQEEIDKIQEDCIHHFKFWSSGAYDDVYVCAKCGKMVER